MLGVKLIFDVRGLMADEYVDAEHWGRKSLAYRVSKLTESRIFAAADGIVTLTNRIWPIIREWDGLRGRNVIHEVVPCCTNLELFRFSDSERERLRKALGLRDKLVLVYSGSIDGWYLTDRMVEFFAYFKSVHPNAHFLGLVNWQPDRLKALMESAGLPANAYTITRVDLNEVPSYLSAADAGMSFITPSFSKLASSPTKYAEYLACGLPIVINRGVGDSDELVNTEKVGVLVSEFDKSEYERVTRELTEILVNPEHPRQHSRAVAKRLFDVRTTGTERYARLYERILSSSHSPSE